MEPITLDYAFTYEEAKLALLETTNSVLRIGKWFPWVGAGFTLSGIMSAIALGLPFSDVSQQICLLYTSPSPRDKRQSRMPSSA